MDVWQKRSLVFEQLVAPATRANSEFRRSCVFIRHCCGKAFIFKGRLFMLTSISAGIAHIRIPEVLD